MTDLKNVPDDELETELKRRAKERKEELELQDRNRKKALREVLSLPTLNVLLPEHTRTSCSDANRINGFYSNGDDSSPRCERCAMLEFLEGMGDDHELRIQFYFRPKKTR